jgi:uncharacterized protein with von Willebrand factor type A (vWA) domain
MRDAPNVFLQLSMEYIMDTTPLGAHTDQITILPITDGSRCLRHDGYDLQVVAEALHQYGTLRVMTEQASQRLATAGALVSDLFLSFYTHVPQLDPIVPVTPAYQINRLILEQVMSTVAWQQTRAAGTVGDMLASALATAGVITGALAGLDQATLAQANRLHELESGTAALFAEAEALDDLATQATGDRAQALFTRAQALRQGAQQHAQDAAQAAQELAQQQEQIADATRRMARTALDQAQHDIDNLNAARTAYGGGQTAPMTTKDTIALAQQVNRSRRLQEVAALCGRLTRIALQVHASTVPHPPDELTSITMGHDLSRVLPSELGMLTDPAREDLFWLAFVEGRLMQYDLIGHEQQGQGPIILALDSSGSMQATAGAAGTTKEVWSKAVKLAILAIARRQQRDMAVLHFSGHDQLAVHTFPRGQAAYPQTIASVEYFFGGGTVFEPWMAQALQLVDQATYNRADVICISDGLTAIDVRARQEWQERRVQRGMRVVSVLIGTQDGAAALAEISDAVLELERLEEDLQVVERVFQV